MEMPRPARILRALLQIFEARGSMVLHVGGQAGRADVDFDLTKSEDSRRDLMKIRRFVTRDTAAATPPVCSPRPYGGERDRGRARALDVALPAKRRCSSYPMSRIKHSRG